MMFVLIENVIKLQTCMVQIHVYYANDANVRTKRQLIMIVYSEYFTLINDANRLLSLYVF